MSREVYIEKVIEIMGLPVRCDRDWDFGIDTSESGRTFRYLYITKPHYTMTYKVFGEKFHLLKFQLNENYRRKPWSIPVCGTAAVSMLFHDFAVLEDAIVKIFLEDDEDSVRWFMSKYGELDLTVGPYVYPYDKPKPAITIEKKESTMSGTVIYADTIAEMVEIVYTFKQSYGLDVESKQVAGVWEITVN